MSQDYVMPVRAIKNLLGKELQSHYSNACQNTHDGKWREFIHRGYHDYYVPKLESCEDYESLDNLIGEFYQMSLEEWINSL